MVPGYLCLVTGWDKVERGVGRLGYLWTRKNLTQRRKVAKDFVFLCGLAPRRDTPATRIHSLIRGEVIGHLLSTVFRADGRRRNG